MPVTCCCSQEERHSCRCCQNALSPELACSGSCSGSWIVGAWQLPAHIRDGAQP